MDVPKSSAPPCCAIRSLLRRDFFTAADWDEALLNFAQVAREALKATEALVALHDAAKRAWTACTSGGRRLQDRTISLYGSKSILERVRSSGRPILTTCEAPLLLHSESIQRHEVQSVLAVPLYFWDVKQPRPKRQIGGCLYAHRSQGLPPFTAEDVDLMRDLTELAQRTLNLLRHVGGVESHLAATEAELGQLRQSAAGRFRLGRYETHEPGFGRSVLEPLRRIAYADKVGLLLLGPSGSGKTHLARAYHYECPRRDKPFVVLDCAQALSAETLGPELFGYAPDSGYANAPRKGLTGKAELAHGGTLFIDEVGALPLGLQQKLLRLIQDGVFSRLGTSEERQVNIQVIAASNEEIEELVRQGRFREDLLQRLQEFTVQVPPLTERLEDVPHLAKEFLQQARDRFGRPGVEGFTREALGALLRHDWSRHGNIRGLAQAVSRSVLLAPEKAKLLKAADLQIGEALSAAAQPAPAPTRAPHPRRTRRPRPKGRSERKDRKGLRELLRRKLRQHKGVMTSMAADPELAEAFGSESGRMPNSSLHLAVRRLGLAAALARERRKANSLDLEPVREAILKHGSATEAAKALGVTRDAVVWQLRKAGLGVSDVLAQRR
jgi:transcriptional regulator with GAF, ATPase, and Fis domain